MTEPPKSRDCAASGFLQDWQNEGRDKIDLSVADRRGVGGGPALGATHPRGFLQDVLLAGRDRVFFRFPSPAFIPPPPTPTCLFSLPSDINLAAGGYYANQTLAVAALAKTVDCVVYDSSLNDTAYTSFTLAESAAELLMAYVRTKPCPPVPPFGPPIPIPCPDGTDQWFSVYAGAAGSITVNYTVNSSGTPMSGWDYVKVSVYSSTYTLIASHTDNTQGSTSGTFTFAVAAEGKYIIHVERFRQIDAATGPLTTTASFDFTFPTGSVVCDAVAIYNDSGLKTQGCCSFLCRNKGGADSGGYAPFAGWAGTKYRKATFAGWYSPCWWHDGDGVCGDPYQPAGAVKQIAQGYNEWQETSPGVWVEVANNSGLYFATDPNGCAAFGDPSFVAHLTVNYFDNTVYYPPDGTPVALFDVAKTATVKTLTLVSGALVCHYEPNPYFEQVLSGYYFGGPLTVTLSEPYGFGDFQTEVGALPWSKWGQAGSFAPCTAMASSASGFVDVECAWKITKAGLTPSTLYQVNVEYWRRPYGSGTMTLYQTANVQATTDSAGRFYATGDIPNDDGYETEARCNCSITPV